MSCMAFAIENIREQAVSTRLGWSFQNYLAIFYILHQARQALGLCFKITACFQVRAFFHYFPYVSERVVTIVAGLDFCRITFTKLEMDILMGGFPVQPGACEVRTAGCRPCPCPKILHDVNRSGFFARFEEHPIPSRRAFLLMSPKKNIRANTLFLICLNHRLKPLLIKISFGGAVVFNRRTPISFFHLPVTGRTPLGHHVGATPT